jgi:gliding motility-associated-like protein
MKLLKRVILTFLYLGTQYSNAQIVPEIFYPTPNIFSVGKKISPLMPTNTGGVVSFTEVSTFAGSGKTGSVDGTGTAASFYVPHGLATDASGNIFVVDVYNHIIRKITPEGNVTTFAGSGKVGSVDGTGTAASFNNPIGVAIDASNNLFISDAGNHKIRKITPEGYVSTFAGNGKKDFADGISTVASFNIPSGLAFDGSILYVVDSYNNKIRKITPEGNVTTFAGSGKVGSVDGTGTAASFHYPQGLCIDNSGNLYLADTYNNKIRKITPEGYVSTFAGSGLQGSVDDIGAAASFFAPADVTFDSVQNLYVTDLNNHKIRKITSEGNVTTFAGSGKVGSVDGTGTAASFFSPSGLIFDSSDVLYVSSRDEKIRKINFNLGSYIITPELPVGLILDATTGEINGTPNDVTPTTEYKITATNKSGSDFFNLSITINDIFPIISYVKDNIYIIGEEIPPLLPTVSGGKVISYSVSPDLVKGLNLNPTTGVITGAASIITTNQKYTITAVNSGGSASFDVSITIKDIFKNDSDGDGVIDESDNCPFIYNPSQEDRNNNGIGDACESTQINVAEAITPNGDGINDTWVISNIENYTNSVVRVFNRWGSEVFVSRNYKNDWDGHYKDNSKSLPDSGSYYYQIDLDGDGVLDKEGWIYINK